MEEKYQRRIDRFQRACLSDHKIVFVRSDCSKQEAVLIRDAIKEKYPSLIFLLVIIGLDNDPWGIEGIENIHASAALSSLCDSDRKDILDMLMKIADKL